MKKRKLLGQESKTEIIEIHELNPEFERLRWVSLAKATGAESRQCLKLIQVKEGKAVALNGVRLHMCDCVSVPDGLYDVVKTTKTMFWLKENKEDYGYPDVSMVFWDKEKAKKQTHVKCRELWIAVWQIFKILEGPIPVDQLIDVLKGQEEFGVFVNGKEDPVLFVNDTSTALIMPIQTE